MLESVEQLQPDLVQGSEDLVGADAWTVSGSRVTGGYWDTFQEMVWMSWVEEVCERRVWPHGWRWWTKTRRKKKKKREFWRLKIHEENLLS